MLFEDSESHKQCEELNNFFSEVGKSLSAKAKPSPTTYRYFREHMTSKIYLFLALTDAHEIQRLIKTFKMKSNSSLNDISYKSMKTAVCIVWEWLSNSFNKCITVGEFPDSRKLSTSFQFLKFRTQVPHLNLDQSLFSQ